MKVGSPAITSVTVNGVAGISALIAKMVPMIMKKPAPKVPRLRPFCGSPPSLVLTRKKPRNEATMPMIAMTSGRMTALMPMPGLAASRPAYQAAPRIIDEIIAPM